MTLDRALLVLIAVLFVVDICLNIATVRRTAKLRREMMADLERMRPKR